MGWKFAGSANVRLYQGPIVALLMGNTYSPKPAGDAKKRIPAIVGSALQLLASIAQIADFIVRLLAHNR